MAPAADDVDDGTQSRIAALTALGLEAKTAASAAQSSKTFEPVHAALSAAKIGNPPEGFPANSDEGRRAASLVYTATVKLGDRKTIKVSVPDSAKGLLFAAIGDGRIAGKVNLDCAFAWIISTLAANEKAGVEAPLSVSEFEAAAGVGVKICLGDVESAIDAALEARKEDILERRYRFNSGLVLRAVMEQLKFVEGKLVRDLLVQKLEALLGPKTETDLTKPAKQKKKANEGLKAGKARAPEKCSIDAEPKEPEDPFAGIPTAFHARGLDSMKNTTELLAKQREVTSGKVICRFPPEPNGYLHVGHAKAMFLDFGFAKKMGGETILRFDDTNPVAEKTEYIDSILDIVSWMGHKPARVTYSSDYFKDLLELAKKLIRRGKAYVCHQTGDEIKAGRESMTESPYRNRSIEENLRLFEDMRKGKYAEGEATLRMKIDMKSVNSVMRDPIAYRVLHTPHPRTGDAWCVYPSYDYTHCIVDSLEWITHSICTLEFEIRRDSYYWLLEALDLYRPFVWEFSRLSLEYTMMSKRKLKELVQRKAVSGWDDPRMPTLSGMRRRGYTPEAINKFCAAIGVSRGQNMIGLHSLEHWVRTDLDVRCPRAFAVLKPLKVVITNFRGEETVVAPMHPKNESIGKRSLKLTEVVYIESSDFRMQDEKSYYGLAPGKTAILRYAYPVTVEDVVVNDGENSPAELRVRMDYEKSVKPKGVLQWADADAPCVEVRLFSPLFKSSDPGALEKSVWLSNVDEESMTVIKGARVERYVVNAKVRDSFQFERTGYFACDDDSTPDAPVFNLVVSLRDSR